MLTAFSLECLGKEARFDFDVKREEIHATAVTASAPAIPKHVINKTRNSEIMNINFVALKIAFFATNINDSMYTRSTHGSPSAKQKHWYSWAILHACHLHCFHPFRGRSALAWVLATF